MHLINKIRSCKAYLVRRLKAIEGAGETKYLSDEVDELNYWLDIANDVTADLKYGSETIETVHDQIIDYVRRNPIEGAFSGEEIDNLNQIEECNYSPPSFEIDINPEPSHYDEPIEESRSSSWAGENYDISRTEDTSTTMDNVGRSRDTPTSIPGSVSGHQGTTAAAPFSQQVTDQLDSDSEWSRDDNFRNMMSFDDQDRRSISRDPPNYDHLHPYKTPSPSPGRVQTPINFQQQQQQSSFHSQHFPFNHHSSDFAAPSNNFRHVPPPSFDPSRVSTRLSGSNYGTSTIIDHGQHHAVRGNSNQNHFNMRAAGQEAQVNMNEIKQKAKQHFSKKKPHRYFQHQIFPINAPRSVVTSQALANQPLPQVQDNENRQLGTTTSNTSCSNETVNESQNTGGVHLLKGVLESVLEGLNKPTSADQSVEQVIQQVLNNALGITGNNKHSPEEAQPTEKTSTGAAAKNKRKPKSSSPPRGRGTKAPVNGKKELQNLKSSNRKKLPKKKIVKIKIPTRKNVPGKSNASGVSSSSPTISTSDLRSLAAEFERFMSENGESGQGDFESVMNKFMKRIREQMATTSTSSRQLENRGRPAVTPTGSEDEEEQVADDSKEICKVLRAFRIQKLKNSNQGREASKNTKSRKRKLVSVQAVEKLGRPAGATDLRGKNCSTKSMDGARTTDDPPTNDEAPGYESEITQRVTRSATASQRATNMTEKVCPVKPSTQGLKKIHAPPILIHPTLKKIKIEQDYVSAVGVKNEAEEMIGSEIDDLCPSQTI